MRESGKVLVLLRECSYGLELTGLVGRLYAGDLISPFAMRFGATE